MRGIWGPGESNWWAQIPAGLPHLVIPNVGFNDILALIPYAAGMALVSYFDTITTARAFAVKGGYRIDPNQDMIALGVANIGAGLFQGFALGCSQSRTVVNDMYGGKSQFAGLMAAGLLALFLLQFTYILKDVPIAALSAIIIAAAFSLLDCERGLKNTAHQTGFGLSQPDHHRLGSHHRLDDRDPGVGGLRHYPGSAPAGPAP